MSDDVIDWPPPYTIKPHARARHVKFKASVKAGLEIIVPRRFNHKYLPGLLNEHRSWIEKQLAKIADQLSASDMNALPEQLAFQALNQTWQVRYLASESKLKLMERPHQEIVLLGNIQDKVACKTLLIKFVKKIAREHLITLLQEISQQTQLNFTAATIRGQTSRWGSCNADKVINLNYKLLFLPEHLTRHILLHELCHTVHLNHSARFWKLVEKFDPNWQAHDKEIRKADKYVPLWIV